MPGLPVQSSQRVSAVPLCARQDVVSPTRPPRIDNSHSNLNKFRSFVFRRERAAPPTRRHARLAPPRLTLLLPAAQGATGLLR